MMSWLVFKSEKIFVNEDHSYSEYSGSLDESFKQPMSTHATSIASV